jgi:GNAT superfamily N-acetyltransferase
VATLRIALTDIATLREQGSALFRAHYEEIARNKGVMVLSPDWHRYEQMEAGGLLFCLAAWVDERLAGYSVTLVAKHLHYSDLLYAQNDVLFVAEEHRKGRLGRDLIAQTERECSARGARLVVWHAKQGTALEALLPRLGYAVQDVMFSKELR